MRCFTAKSPGAWQFYRYVPHGLLLIVALELMQAQVWLVWLLEQHTDDRPWLMPMVNYQMVHR